MHFEYIRYTIYFIILLISLGSTIYEWVKPEYLNQEKQLQNRGGN